MDFKPGTSIRRTHLGEEKKHLMNEKKKNEETRMGLEMGSRPRHGPHHDLLFYKFLHNDQFLVAAHDDQIAAPTQMKNFIILTVENMTIE